MKTLEALGCQCPSACLKCVVPKIIVITAQVVTFGTEQLIGQLYRVFKLTRYMLPADGRGHKVCLFKCRPIPVDACCQE